MEHDEILRTNRRVYDAMAAAGDPLCRPAKDEELANPLRTVDAAGWLGESIAGKNVLCLAAGGGRQSSLYAAAGAVVTVVDISGAMLELDRQTAAQRGYSLRIYEASMDNLSMLQPGEFDIVVHPVSTCYVPDILAVFCEVARVLRGGGLYISQHKQPASLQASVAPLPQGGFHLEQTYYRDQPIPQANPAGGQDVSNTGRRLREKGALEFVHRWEEIIGGMCRAGFAIEDLTEPLHAKADSVPGSFGYRARYLAPYVRIKARRTAMQSAANSASGSLWIPDA